jgi:hypothetical protein
MKIDLSRMDSVRRKLRAERLALRRERDPQERLLKALRVQSLRKELRRELEAFGATFA